VFKDLYGNQWDLLQPNRKASGVLDVPATPTS
jgi:hypothetical protein